MDSTKTTSIDFVKQAIERGDVNQAIQCINSEMHNEANQERTVLLRINSAIAKISIQMLRGCINDCEYAISSSTFACFLKGLAYLWMDKEKEAITSWQTGIEFGGPVSYYSIMNRLIIDPNARSFIHSKRYNILEILKFLEKFDKTKAFSDNDIQVGYSQLRTNSLLSAINIFQAIITNNPRNFDAIKGRGTAFCLTGQWKKAIDDFTIVLNKKIDIGNVSKFRAICYAALGKYTAAIADFSIAILNSPFDLALFAERGKLHMLRKCYQLALADFKKIPKSSRNNTIRGLIMECYYAIGDLCKAIRKASKIKEADHRIEYTQYLIYRDNSSEERALKHLKKALELHPCFFLQRTAGDYEYDCGHIKEALFHYRIALKLKENDAETRRLYALALIQLGNVEEGIEILKALAEAWKVEESEIDMSTDIAEGLALNGYIKNFYQEKPNLSILEQSNKDLKYLNVYFVNPKKPVSFHREKVDHINENKSDDTNKDKQQTRYKFTKEKLKEEEIQLCIDADRIGEHCCMTGTETDNNQRKRRCCGLIALLLTYKFQTLFFTEAYWKDGEDQSCDWKDVFNLMIPLLRIIDFRLNVDWRTDVYGNGTAKLSETPAYYIQRGEHVSSRFLGLTQQVINIFQAKMLGDSLRLSLCNNLNEIYSFITQSEEEKLTTTITTTTLVSLKWYFNKKIMLDGPTLNYKHLGAHGHELYFCPHCEPKAIRKNEEAFQVAWKSLLSTRDDPKNKKKIPPNHLVRLILLTWVHQPLTNYSIEAAHIILHAFLLANYQHEFLSLFGEIGEIAFESMLSPNRAGLRSKIMTFMSDKKITNSVNESSLNYWRNDVSYEKLCALIDTETNPVIQK